MEIETSRFKRALLFNSNLGNRILPSLVFKLTRTPRFGFRATNILQALKTFKRMHQKGRLKLTQVAEFGVARGEGLRQLYILTSHFCKINGMPLPKFYGFDSFEGLHSSDNPADIGTWAPGDYKGDYDRLQAMIKDFGWEQDCTLVRGRFHETLPKMTDDFSPEFILIDCDYYTSTKDVFVSLKDRLKSGSIIYFDDLGTNFYNKNMGEERFIHELNEGVFGKSYYLYPLTDHLYFWSNSEKPCQKNTDKTLDIPLKYERKLGKVFL